MLERNTTNFRHIKKSIAILCEKIYDFEQIIHYLVVLFFESRTYFLSVVSNNNKNF